MMVVLRGYDLALISNQVAVVLALLFVYSTQCVDTLVLRSQVARAGRRAARNMNTWAEDTEGAPAPAEQVHCNWFFMLTVPSFKRFLQLLARSFTNVTSLHPCRGPYRAGLLCTSSRAWHAIYAKQPASRAELRGSQRTAEP